MNLNKEIMYFLQSLEKKICLKFLRHIHLFQFAEKKA